MSFKIETVTAFVSIDKNGEESVMAVYNNCQWMPLICADEERIKSMAPIAENLKKMSGKDYRIIQFSFRRDITIEIKEKYLK